jgi:acetoin utilization deacetylase AcuC-like enzyme
MEISPAGYGYMTGLLCQTGIPLCLLMEGGYFLQSVAQGALFCMRALIQKVNFPSIPHSIFLMTFGPSLLSEE